MRNFQFVGAICANILLVTAVTILVLVDSGWAWTAYLCLSVMAVFLVVLWWGAFRSKGFEIGWDDKKIWKRAGPGRMPIWECDWVYLKTVDAFDQGFCLDDGRQEFQFRVPKGGDGIRLLAEIGRHLVDTAETEEARPFVLSEARVSNTLKFAGVAMVGFLLVMTGDWMHGQRYFGPKSSIYILLKQLGFMAFFSGIWLSIYSHRKWKNSELARSDRMVEDVLFDVHGELADDLARLYRHVWSHKTGGHRPALPEWRVKR